MKLNCMARSFMSPLQTNGRDQVRGWWIEKTDENVAKITFEEPITFDTRLPSKTNNYSLSISNINENGDVDTYNVDEDGFIMIWKDYSNETCMASFQLFCKSTGKGTYVPLCTGGGPGIMRAAAQGARNQDAHGLGSPEQDDMGIINENTPP